MQATSRSGMGGVNFQILENQGFNEIKNASSLFRYFKDIQEAGERAGGRCYPRIITSTVALARAQHQPCFYTRWQNPSNEIHLWQANRDKKVSCRTLEVFLTQANSVMGSQELPEDLTWLQEADFGEMIRLIEEVVSEHFSKSVYERIFEKSSCGCKKADQEALKSALCRQIESVKGRWLEARVRQEAARLAAAPPFYIATIEE